MYLTSVNSMSHLKLYEVRKIEDLEKNLVDNGIELVIKNENSESTLRNLNQFIL